MPFTPKGFYHSKVDTKEENDYTMVADFQNRKVVFYVDQVDLLDFLKFASFVRKQYNEIFDGERVELVTPERYEEEIIRLRKEKRENG